MSSLPPTPRPRIRLQTPDSQATLRCTSTQAQVLLADSVSLSLVLAPPEPAGGQSHWQQRPLAAPGSGQIKQKHLHQFTRASASQQHPGAANAHRPAWRQEPASSGAPALARPAALLVLALLAQTLLLLPLTVEQRRPLVHWRQRTPSTS